MMEMSRKDLKLPVLTHLERFFVVYCESSHKNYCLFQ